MIFNYLDLRAFWPDSSRKKPSTDRFPQFAQNLNLPAVQISAHKQARVATTTGPRRITKLSFYLWSVFLLKILVILLVII